MKWAIWVQTFESIEVYAFVPPSRDNMKDEVVVKNNIEKATNHLHLVRQS